MEVKYSQPLSEVNQLPLAIQPHNILVACSVISWRITHISQNISLIIDQPLSFFIGQPLDNLLEQSVIVTLKTRIKEPQELEEINPLRVHFKNVDKVVGVQNLLAHLDQDLLILEFEPINQPTTILSFQGELNKTILKIQQAESLEILANTVAGGLKKMIGYDRVQVCQFKEEYVGEVIAEAKEMHLNSFLKMPFDVNDIPPQTRIQHSKAPVRIIADLLAQPVQIYSGINKALDLTKTTVVGTMPSYVQRLAKIEAKAILSIPIIFNNILWGLLICYHSTPRFLDYNFRTACHLLGQIFSGHLSLLSNADLWKKKFTKSQEELESFIYSVSHDLKAPIRTIKGFIDIVIEDYKEDLDEEGQSLLQMVSGSAVKLNQYIDEILKLSRIERQTLIIKKLDVAEQLQKIYRSFGQNEKTRDIVFVLKEPLPPIWGDEILLFQVFKNLLSNSIKFTKPISKTIIEVGGKLENGKTYLYIKDNGIGFNPKYTNRIYKLFDRLVREKDFEGIGAGLSIVKKIIEKHQGVIWAESELGKGATFYIEIPTKE